MRFAIIRPAEQRVEFVHCKGVREAVKLAGLNGVDHGLVTRRLGLFTYEYSLADAPAGQAFFSIGEGLYAGNTVLYQFDEDSRESVDIEESAIPPIAYYPNAAAVERAIELGLLPRPQVKFNGVVIWEWRADQGETRPLKDIPL